MNTSNSDHISKQFLHHFSIPPTLSVQAPGRINLIGEHTDYNNGFVLPAAIDKKICFAFAITSPDPVEGTCSGSVAGTSPNLMEEAALSLSKGNNSSKCRVVALDKQESYNFDLSDKSNIPTKGWQKYIAGMAHTFLSEGQGFDCVFGGDLSPGAGMSSSSAICCGLAYGLNLLFDLGHEKEAMVPLIQKAEATCSGVNGGIMDQFSIMMGKKEKAILLDCQDLSYEYLPLDLQNHCLLLCNTAVEHELATTEYNTRRQECESGIALLQKLGLDCKSLRDVRLADLEKLKAHFDPVVFKRCAYVIKENERVLKAVSTLKERDLTELGKLLYQSHEGLQYDYEVSCPELDFLVAFAKTQDYVLGARMMGGGFGGCTLNLLPSNKVDEFLASAEAVYLRQFGIYFLSYEVLTGEGVTAF